MGGGGSRSWAWSSRLGVSEEGITFRGSDQGDGREGIGQDRTGPGSDFLGGWMGRGGCGDGKTTRMMKKRGGDK